MTLSSLSNFITTRLGRMKAWAAYNSLDWVTCYLLHFTVAYIVYRESRTRQVVCVHVLYGVHGEMYIGIESQLIDLSLCCIICSQIKKIRVLVAKPELLISCHPNERQSAVFPPADHCDSTPAWESPKWADNLAGRGVERNVRSMPRQIVAVRAHERPLRWGGLCKIRSVWTVWLFRVS